MDEMSSVEFRKRYAKLTSPTVVTVLGRRIGVWTPHTGGRLIPASLVDEITHHLTAPGPYRSFTPAPKPGKR